MLEINKKIGTILIWVGCNALSNPGWAATHIDQLKVECGGSYAVEASEPYYVPPLGRRMARSGLSEKIKVLSITGKDCNVIAKNYGVTLMVGQSLNFATAAGLDLNELEELAQSRLGQNFNFKATQSFKYATPSGSLPIFPTVHEEWIHILGMTAKAKSESMYGTPEIDTLNDKQLMFVLKHAIWQIEWGNKFQHSNGSSSNPWVSLIVDLMPSAAENIKQHLTDLVNVFENISRFSGSFATYHPGMLIGQKINSKLNEHESTKWATKLEVFKANPLLFDDQILGWSFLSKSETAPSLDGEEVNDFLKHALEVSQNLSKVPQVLEARYLLSQYKTAAKSIKLHDGETTGKQKLYDLDDEANTLINAIQTVKH